jgi:uncharacterized membrane protein YedE/YeeE
MAAALISPIASGAIFGGALSLSGVASPRIIIEQLRLNDFHMLLAFMSASACSALVVAASNASGHARLGHRKDSTYGWLARYEGNIIGGALQGMSMALMGACPGTVLVQAAAGVGRGWLAILGGVVGGTAFVRWKESAKGVESPGLQHTVMDKTGLSTSTAVLGYEIMMLAFILAASTMAPRSQGGLDPVLGGVLIGLAQCSSVLLSRKTLGVSSAYEDAGRWFWSLARGTTRPGWSNIIFAAGVIAGTKIALHYIPAASVLMSSDTDVSPLAAFFGGVAMIFGGRLAGGCTSGHGISGMATLSLSSFITVVSMFSAGIATALALR